MDVDSISRYQTRKTMRSKAEVKGQFWVSPDLEVVSVAPEILVPRLGDRLIENGLLNSEELDEALNYQKGRAAEEKPILLGEALITLGFIDREELNRTITGQIANLQEDLFQSKALLEQRVEERTAELQQALDEITELNRVKADFVGNMSHELRTPLAHIVGYVDLLDDESLGPLTGEQRKAVEVLKRSNQRLNGLIDNLLFISFDQEDKLFLNLKSTLLSDFIGDIAQRTREKVEAQKLQFVSKIPEKLPPVSIDAGKMDWAISQLTDNAIKFNRPNGKVAIKLEKGAEFVKLIVQDSGIGIPQDKLKEIFEPFYQIDSSSTRKYGGAGLGLSLAKRIVESHGSQISSESVMGKGSCFTFYLPIDRGDLG